MKTLICKNCKYEAKEIEFPKIKDRIVCPKCGYRKIEVKEMEE